MEIDDELVARAIRWCAEAGRHSTGDEMRSALAPLSWDELPDVAPEDFTLETMVERFAKLGDCHKGIDARPCTLRRLLELVERQEKEGQGDAPWPPHYRKGEDEPARVQPSRRRA